MKVLIATDFSDYALFAVEYIVNQRWMKDTEFKFLTFIQPEAGMKALGGTRKRGNPDKERTVMEQRVLQRIHKKLLSGLNGYPVSSATKIGEPVSCILDIAEIWGADLIVAGFNDEYSHLNKNSKVSERVARAANCSVNVLRIKRVHSIVRSETSIAIIS